MDRSRQRGGAGAIKWGLMLLAVVVLPAFIVWWQDAPVAAAPGALLWRNALPLGLFALLLYGLSGRPLFTALATFGIGLALFKVNAIKEVNMNQPLLPGDVVLRHQLAANLGFFARYLGHSWMLVLGMLLGVAALVAIWWIERRYRQAMIPCVACVLLSLLGLVTLFRGDGPWKAAYSEAPMPAFPLWEPIAGVRKAGVLAGLVRLTQESQVTVPKADKQKVIGFVDRHQDDIAQRANRDVPASMPDIVVVQSEAFFEPGVLKGIDFGEYVPNFHRLAQQGISGPLATPAYGGGTIRTEFETLTGYPVLAFPSVTYPYYGLVADWMPSVPQRLDHLGYTTRLFHPFKSSFWNRAEVIPQLGFEHEVYQEGFKDAAHAGYYVSDEALFDRVLASLDRHTDTPQFDMAITMENHGPWDADVGKFGAILDDMQLPTGLSEKGRLEFEHYMSHVVNGDRALGQFADKLLSRSRWTVLVFYGDHLPALPHAFRELGFDNGDPSTSQHTRYMILSNRPLDARRQALHAYDLPGLLFDTIGLPADGYLAIEAETRRLTRDQAEKKPPNVMQPVVFNAARLEVRCKARLDTEGACSHGAGGADVAVN